MLKFDIAHTDRATPLLKRLHSQLAPGRRTPFMTAAGRALLRVLQAHFTQRNFDTSTKRARKGFPKQNFWNKEVRDNTHLAEVTADTATVRIASRPFVMKVHGGIIRPGPGKRALAIPLTRDTYGKRASSNPIKGGLFVWRSPKTGKAFLAGTIPDAFSGSRLKLYYRLIASVRQKADPRALPPEATTRAAIDAEALRFINRILNTPT